MSKIERVKISKKKLIRVLQIDDDELLLDLTIDFFQTYEEEQISVETLIDPEKVIEQIREKKYDIIVSDYEMGKQKLNGLDLLRQIREMNIDIPFIIFTGNSREDFAIKALNSGVDYYLKKKSNLVEQFHELSNIIRMVVDYKRTEKALRESERQFKITLNSMIDPIHVVNENLDFIIFNDAFREFNERLGLAAKLIKIIGRNINDVFPFLPEKVFEEYEEVFKTNRIL